ncbi:hypothetical protein QFC21_004373 [Naganishia friedmannii]|uniref:Uncharacterized protein n=1 Tax=Naganishia friedmannii TaxID=89922 RepID=A0ACC2VH54_9TREE|nr:hypothetical protein QFC21_004373 [Naganishia friedmannii]
MPSAIRARSPTPDSAIKKPRLDSTAALPAGPAIVLPADTDVSNLAEKYQTSAPYKHISVASLFDDEVLQGVVTESRTYGTRHAEGSLPGWGWEHKETDIYKIQQTPDLTSLDPQHLPEETLAKLPYLSKLKESIYSDPPDSPSKSTEQPLVTSTDGSFLKGWEPSWGGALELYPIEADSANKEVGPPATKRSTKVDVKWGNLVFFEVQPGRSYHSVEEVVVGDGRQRLGVSGWFHRPVEGEEGYEKQDEAELKASFSSLAQITATPSHPMTSYPEDVPPPTGLTSANLKHLSKYLAPSYLNAATLERLAGQFVEGSEVVMHNFLKPEIAEQIKQETQALDTTEYAPYALENEMHSLIPAQELGESDAWQLQGPSSKHRYLSLQTGADATASKTPTLHAVLTDLYPTEAFRAWLSVVSSLVVLAYRVEARRFRKGLDYTLAAGEEKDGEPRLDAVLGLTWWRQGKETEDEDDEKDVGGWECYIAPPEAGSDPAVYQSSKTAKIAEAVDNGDLPPSEAVAQGDSETATAAEPKSKPTISMGGVELEVDESQLSDGDFDTDDEEDDGPLLSLYPNFNCLLLVLRDPGVMKFVKYLSNAAAGSRYDVSAEYEVGQLEEEDEEEGDEVKA